MTIAITIAAGVLAGLLGMFVARAVRLERQMYPGLLLLLPVFYALFAVSAGDGRASLLELAVGLPWIAVGLACLLIDVRRSALILGCLWILHAVFDLAHGLMPENPGLPSWYPLWCAAVDIVVGGYLLWLSARLPGPATEARRRLARATEDPAN